MEVNMKLHLTLALPSVFVRGHRKVSMSRFVAFARSVIVLSVVACSSGDSRLPTTPPRFAQLELVPRVGEPLFGDWHRLNTAGEPATSEHLIWHFRIEANIWDGRFDKHPEPRLGFPNPPNGDFGIFTGVEKTTGFVCRPAFPFYPCQDVVAVVEGTTLYHPASGPLQVFEQQIVVRDASGHEVLWEYWISPGNFVCPWYRTFDAALASNPFPAHQDCIFPVAGVSGQ
jgi:hypothetical protein